MNGKGRLDAQIIQRMLSDLSDGENASTVAKKYGVNRNTVRWHADKAGIAIQTGARGSDPLKEEIKRLRKENTKLKVLIAESILEGVGGVNDQPSDTEGD